MRNLAPVHWRSFLYDAGASTPLYERLRTMPARHTQKRVCLYHSGLVADTVCLSLFPSVAAGVHPLQKKKNASKTPAVWWPLLGT